MDNMPDDSCFVRQNFAPIGHLLGTDGHIFREKRGPIYKPLHSDNSWCYIGLTKMVMAILIGVLVLDGVLTWTDIGEQRLQFCKFKWRAAMLRKPSVKTGTIVMMCQGQIGNVFFLSILIFTSENPLVLCTRRGESVIMMRLQWQFYCGAVSVIYGLEGGNKLLQGAAVLYI